MIRICLRKPEVTSTIIGATQVSQIQENVKAGDMVIADGDGVIVVPQRLIVPVLDKTESIASAEVNAQKAYASGRDPDEVEKEYGAA